MGGGGSVVAKQYCELYFINKSLTWTTLVSISNIVSRRIVIQISLYIRLYKENLSIHFQLYSEALKKLQITFKFYVKKVSYSVAYSIVRN